MKEHASTGAVPADSSVEKLVNELAGMAYSYAVELDAATRDADHGELEAVSRRITVKLREAIRKALSGAQAVPAFPAPTLKAAILAASRTALAHDVETAGLETSIGHLERLVNDLRPDAERYREFIDCGFPITFLGVDYCNKAALDAAIDATRGAGDGRA